MKLRRFCTALALSLSLALASASAKNSVYKGTLTTTDLVTGQVQALSLYLVLGDEQPITEGNDAYTKISGTFVVVGQPLGKKRYGTTPAGLFRSLELIDTTKKQPRTVEIISQILNPNSTSENTGLHSVAVNVLSGVHTNPLYDTPMTLSGTGLSTSGYLRPDGSPAGGATRQAFKLALVKSLTDPIPSGESLADTVNRLTTYLEQRGFLPFAP